MVIEQDFLKQSRPVNFSYHPVLSCQIPFNSSLMAILLMLSQDWYILMSNYFQGTLPEGEGSAQLTSLLSYLVLSMIENIF